MQMLGFWLAHVVAIIGWISLFTRRSEGIAVARGIAGVLALGYSIVFLSSLGAAGILAEQYDLTGISAFFSNSNLALAGWIHYLAFDLFVGSWIAAEGDDKRLRPALIHLCLILTFLTGPIGLLAFLGSATFFSRSKLFRRSGASNPSSD